VNDADAQTMVSLIERIANLSGERCLRPPSQCDVDKMEDTKQRLASILRNVQYQTGKIVTNLELAKLAAHRRETPRKGARKP